ncbi:hypothetical protein [Ochrobactrum sp. A-1]|uniref:hypothetical protein n=1 Tax=Ochrobactrum sp. A-1 TaxID=2920940 RepID=UPI001F0A345E|nr:hypothetical protein [Ochrobactrum sp. A-1]
MSSKKTYVVNAEGFIAGAHRTKGARIQLTDREAKYLVLSGLVGEASVKAESPKAEPSPVVLDKKTR